MIQQLRATLRDVTLSRAFRALAVLLALTAVVVVLLDQPEWAQVWSIASVTFAVLGQTLQPVIVLNQHDTSRDEVAPVVPPEVVASYQERWRSGLTPSEPLRS